MKKIVIITITVIACLIGSIQIVRIKTSAIPSDMIDIKVVEVSVETLSEDILKKGTIFDSDISIDMYENPHEYMVIHIKYQIMNHSDIVMSNVRYEPSLFTIMRYNIKTYNSGNGEYLISVYSGNEQSFEQYMIAEDNGKTNMEMFTLFMDASIRLEYGAIPKYFYLQDENTGWLEHSHKFRIRDVYVEG